MIYCPVTIPNTYMFISVGSELRAWILYYCIPVLYSVLPTVYLRHVGCLVGALHILTSNKIKSSDLDRAQILLSHFYTQLPVLYGIYVYTFYSCCLSLLLIAGDNAATMKSHLLHHAVYCVRNWGPLWAYTCFTFEGMNHHVKLLFHGNREMSKQVGFHNATWHCAPVDKLPAFTFI